MQFTIIFEDPFGPRKFTNPLPIGISKLGYESLLGFLVAKSMLASSSDSPTHVLSPLTLGKSATHCHHPLKSYKHYDIGDINIACIVIGRWT